MRIDHIFADIFNTLTDAGQLPNDIAIMIEKQLTKQENFTGQQLHIFIVIKSIHSKIWYQREKFILVT